MVKNARFESVDVEVEINSAAYAVFVVHCLPSISLKYIMNCKVKRRNLSTKKVISRWMTECNNHFVNKKKVFFNATKQINLSESNITI